MRVHKQQPSRRTMTSTVALISGLTATAFSAAILGAGHALFSYLIDTSSPRHISKRAGIDFRNTRHQRNDSDQRKTSLPTTSAHQQAIHRWFYETRQSVMVRSKDNLKLYGWLTDSDSAHPMSHVYVICYHGFTSNPTEMEGYAQRFAAMGCNVLLPALRAHERSEGRYVGMGWLEHEDLSCWVNFIKRLDPESMIILHGVSSGAAAIMMYAGEPDASEHVVAAIADCGFSSARHQLYWNARHFTHIPRCLTTLIIESFSIFTHFQANFNIDDASALTMLAHSSIPLLFIQGSADTLVDPNDITRNFEACSSKTKAMLIIPGAEHALSAQCDPKLYWKTIEAFLHPLLKQSK